MDKDIRCGLSKLVLLYVSPVHLISRILLLLYYYYYYYYYGDDDVDVNTVLILLLLFYYYNTNVILTGLLTQLPSFSTLELVAICSFCKDGTVVNKHLPVYMMSTYHPHYSLRKRKNILLKCTVVLSTLITHHRQLKLQAISFIPENNKSGSFLCLKFEKCMMR